MLAFPMARAFLAGAALLAGAHARTAHAGSSDTADEVAFAVPRLPEAGGEVTLPRPLGSADARRIRRLFALQAEGDIPAALALTARLSDQTLLGHILADRYLRPDWQGCAEDLASWLAAYGDLPDAPGIFARYTALLPKGSPIPAAPAVTPPLALPPPEASGVARNLALDRGVQARIRGGQFDAASRLIRHTRGLDTAYASLLEAELAQALFFANRDAEALGAAEAAFHRGKGRPALAAYVAGLAAWRLERPDLARSWFEAAWRAPGSDAPGRAGAAFWAARAELRAGTGTGYSFWLARAGRETGTFYGQIARHAAGIRPGAGPPAQRPTLGIADVSLLDSTPAGHRAFSLLQVGQTDRAEAELRRLWGLARDVPGMGRAIALVAEQAGLQELSTALLAVLDDGQDPSAPPLLPVPRLRPAGGFRIDPALVYGVARVESNFDAAAVSPMGATGLMQLMPVTASFLAGGRSIAPAAVAQMLRDPGGNLRLGQRYLLYLADAVDGDLLGMLAAYNTGLTGFNRWAGDIRHMDDPLMFIESIPVAETRAYVSRALSFTWTYAAQLGLPAPSLDDLAAGVWPRFTAPDPVRADVRRAAARLH